MRRAGGKPIRVASKSVRCRALLERVLARDGFAGIMSFTLAESLWLARAGFDDVLLAYPSADRAGFAELAGDPKLAAAVTVMVDDPAQLELIDACAGRRHAKRSGSAWSWTPRCSCWAAGSASAPGARRCATPRSWPTLARAVARRPGFRLVGLMAYEGHVAGVGDAVGGPPAALPGDPADAGARPAGSWPRGGRRWCGRYGRWRRTWSSSTAAARAVCSTPRPRTR